MADKQDTQNIVQYCAGIMHPQLKILNRTAQKIIRRKNIEDVHDLRVSSRRIRECLNIFSDYLPAKKQKSWLKEIKNITKSYGNVRDLDVQLDLVKKIFQGIEDKRIRSGLRRLRLRLKQKREKKHADTEKNTHAIIDSVALVEMIAWTEAATDFEEKDLKNSEGLLQLGYKQIQARLDKFLFFEVFIFNPARIEELHQMRIAAKQLRYALEIFSDLYERNTDFALDIARQTQQYLGEIHDEDVWLSYLPKFLDTEYQKIKGFYGYTSPFNRIKPGIEYFLENRKKERNRLYQEFLIDWKNWKMKETWLNLRKVIFLTSLDENMNEETRNPAGTSRSARGESISP